MNKFCSMFSQILPLISKNDFVECSKATKAQYHSRGFSSWDQMVAMLFCQLGRANSLREICGGLATCEGKLSHMGMDGAPKRSTLAYANEHRPYQMFEQLYYMTLARIQRAYPGKHRFRFKNKLISMDATVIDLCAKSFDWAHFRKTKGAVKLHLQLDHDGYLPSFAVITEGKTHEVTIARSLSYPAGTILVFDRGYNDYGWFQSLTNDGVFFVTRMKDNALFEVQETHAVPEGGGVVSDQTVLVGGKAGANGENSLRRIEFFDAKADRDYVFLTNNFKLASSTIAAIYKERWQIELFFKAIKQNLKIKTFLGTSANALKTQVWTALLAMLLLRYLQLKSTFNWSFSNLLALLRMSLFVHRDLWKWLDQPFTAPPDIPEPPQQTLQFA